VQYQFRQDEQNIIINHHLLSEKKPTLCVALVAGCPHVGHSQQLTEIL